MKKYIDKDLALSYPFANGQYDKKNANPHFINGCESYKEWLESLPAAEPLTAADLLELEHRFGRGVREVVEDMLKGEGKRWQNT